MSIEAAATEESFADKMLFLFALANNRYQNKKAEYDEKMEPKPKWIRVGSAVVAAALLGGGYYILFGSAKGVK